ncbi:MAG: glycosyltransferase, partial [Candidatus Omnitrophota bacterium]
ELVSIIVVNGGRSPCFAACLDSLQKQTFPNLEIIVIDSHPEGLSYCQSLNRGIAQSKGDFILCLNDDVVLQDDFVEQALKGFVVDDKIGMVSGKILRMDKKTIDSTGLFLSVFRSAQERGYGKPDFGQFAKPGFIFGVCGAVAFYRKAMLEELRDKNGYFDERFGYFYEDLDIAWRAQRRNWKGYYAPQAIAYHVRGATVRQGKGIDKKFARMYLSKDLLMSLIKNRYLTILKNESALGFLLHLPFILLYDAFAWAHFLCYN